jgi:lipoprotein NlpI
MKQLFVRRLGYGWTQGSVLALWLVLGAFCTEAAEKSKPSKAVPTAASILDEAQTAYAKKDVSQAMNLINRAMKLEPRNPRPYFARARLYSSQGDSEKAIQDFDRVLELDPTSTDVLQLRGIERFRQGHAADAVRDFNSYLTAVPNQTPYHWQRGIAFYYTDQFAEGRRQFEMHQSVNPQDVENSAWHFFCIARVDGADKAREALLPVSQDTRVPMAQIYALLAGQGTPEQVLEAARIGNPSPLVLDRNLFYAHLYLGLYFEALKQDKLSREHIEKAVHYAPKDDYMASVARVHAKVRKITSKSK